MRPGQAREVEIHRLHVLDLGVGDGDRFRRRDVVRRLHFEGRSGLRAGVGRRDPQKQGLISSLRGRNLEVVLHGLDPEGGGHAHRAGVGAGLNPDPGRGALQEVDVGGSAG